MRVVYHCANALAILRPSSRRRRNCGDVAMIDEPGALADSSPGCWTCAPEKNRKSRNGRAAAPAGPRDFPCSPTDTRCETLARHASKPRGDGKGGRRIHAARAAEGIQKEPRGRRQRVRPARAQREACAVRHAEDVATQASGNSAASSACGRRGRSGALLLDGSPNCPGASPKSARSTSPVHAACSTKTISISRKSAAHAWSSWRSQAQPGRQGTAALLRRAAGVGKTSLGSPSRAQLPKVRPHPALAACMTRRKSAATGAPIVAPCRATSSTIRRAGERNCVVMLDEVDKLGGRVPGRSGLGLLRSARPRAERHVPRRPISVCPTISAACCHRPANVSRHHSRPCVTGWKWSGCPATPRGEAGDRAGPPDPSATATERPDRGHRGAR